MFLRRIPGIILLFFLLGCGGGGGSSGPGSGTQRLPDVALVASPSVTENSAVLFGNVTPNGSPTVGWFEYGADASLATPDNTAHQPVGSGIDPIPINSSVYGLGSSTTYYYRICASNALGTARSSIRSLVTLAPGAPLLPGVSTLGPTSVSETGAMLNGRVNPKGRTTDAWFEWGTDPALAGFASTPRRPLGSGSVDLPVQESIPGLTAGGTYYFRVAAANSDGTSRGEIRKFIAYSCVGCHGGDNGDQPPRFNAPKVTRYWKTSGHGKSTPRPAATCEDCHDVGSPPGTHAADGTGVVNTENWPGKPENTVNSNTSHLRPFLLNGGTAAQLQSNFDIGCVNGPGGGTVCHIQWGVQGHRHSMAADNLVQFGRGSTTEVPKSFGWYAQSDYEVDFYKSRSPWVIQDLTSDATGTVFYAPCVSCHDPHGTGSTNYIPIYGNAMVRGNFATESAVFCNSACHTN